MLQTDNEYNHLEQELPVHKGEPSEPQPAQESDFDQKDSPTLGPSRMK